MANVFATNFAIPGANNIIQIPWKLTRTMKAAGWTYKASSNGTSKDTSGVAANDLWGGNADPTTDAYPSLDAVNAWWVGSGPQTLKIPITTASTGTFVRGEKITQATSTAEGELVGYVFDPVSVTGWLVVLPRTGTFDNTHLITGTTSAATITPNGTIITYAREVMIGKVSTSTVQGSVYYVCADASGESASLFSTLATSAGCTTAVWPGGGGTGNSFPAIAITILGTGGSTSGNSSLSGDSGSIASGGHAQICTVNATPATGISADGSFYIIMSTAAANSLSSGWMFTRLDDSEPGDVDPYIWVASTNLGPASFSRTAPITGFQLFNSGNNGTIESGLGSVYYMVGYQARGLSGRDFVSGYGTSLVSSINVGNKFAIACAGTNVAIRVVNSPATTPPMIREHLIVFINGAITTTTNFKQIKGRTRWVACMPVGATLDTYDSKTWLVVNAPSILHGALMIGPYDGATTPIN